MSGVMGTSHHTHGGGVNHLCLPLDPQFPDNVQQGDQSGAYVYGVEYERSHSDRFFASVHDQDAPCAVCEVQGRSQVLMIPAKQTCPDGWTLEYEGLLASESHSHDGGEFVCVSNDPETTPAGHTNEYGGRLFVVEATCDTLPCPPYVAGYELSCVICTK